MHLVRDVSNNLNREIRFLLEGGAAAIRDAYVIDTCRLAHMVISKGELLELNVPSK